MVYNFNMNWCFAIINNRLAEIYFESKRKRNPKVIGHCYVKREEYRTKKEQKMIEEDIVRYKFSYRKKIYKD